VSLDAASAGSPEVAEARMKVGSLPYWAAIRRSLRIT
jgi:hypothetical protein